jgi:hypothetical protein
MLKPCAIISPVTNEELSGKYHSWWIRYRGHEDRYEYGELVFPTESKLWDAVGKHDIPKVPIIIKSKKESKVGWICSFVYMYRKTPQVKMRIRLSVDSLKYCEHIEKVKEKYNAKQSN